MDATSGTVSSAINLKAAALAGLFAGLVFLVLEMIMVPLFLGGSPWGPPRMIGAMALGEGVLPPPATFDLMVVMVAMLIHFALSVVLAIGMGFVIGRMSMEMALGVGAAFGLVLYLVNFYLIPSLGLFTWFEGARNWVSIFTHIVFGVLVAWAYRRWAAPAATY